MIGLVTLFSVIVGTIVSFPVGHICISVDEYAYHKKIYVTYIVIYYHILFVSLT